MRPLGRIGQRVDSSAGHRWRVLLVYDHIMFAPRRTRIFLATLAASTGGAFLGVLGEKVFIQGMPLPVASSAALNSWVIFPGFFLGLIGARRSLQRAAKETPRQEAVSGGGYSAPG